MPPANARALADPIPGAKLKLLQEAGHPVFTGRFADVNREVVRALKSRNTGPVRAATGRPAGRESREPERWLTGVIKAFRGWMSRERVWIGVPRNRESGSGPKRVDCVPQHKKSGLSGGRHERKRNGRQRYDGTHAGAF